MPRTDEEQIPNDDPFQFAYSNKRSREQYPKEEAHHEANRWLPTPNRLLDVKEAAALLNVPESWIYQHVRARTENKLPHFKLGKYLRFSAQALTRWLEIHQSGSEIGSLVIRGNRS